MTQALPIVFVALLLFAATPAFAQAGGEVVDVRVTHVVSSIGAPTPPDQIQLLLLRVVDERGHAFTQAFGSLGTTLDDLLKSAKSASVSLTESDVKRWLAGGEERRLLLID